VETIEEAFSGAESSLFSRNGIDLVGTG